MSPILSPRIQERLPAEVEVLARFVAAGVFDAAEVQLAAMVARLRPGLGAEVILALAVAARGPRLGHVCVDLAEVGDLVVDRRDDPVGGLDWPDVERWGRALAASDVVATPSTSREPPLRPLVWDGRRVYLQRYWHHEQTVAEDLLRRCAADDHVDSLAAAGLDAALDTLFPSPPAGSGPADLQRQAAFRALTNRVSVIVGGPGTGKTHTVARLLAAAHQVAAERGIVLQVALAAPTGKAAARMADAIRTAPEPVQGEAPIDPSLAETLRHSEPTTLHRLLGWAPGATFRHDRRRPLPHDLIVVDEASMVSLPLMSGLLAACRPGARVVLVGDPFQLASVEAGSVLSDVVGPAGQPDQPHQPDDRPSLSGRVTLLRRAHRFSADSAIAALADAIRAGDADEAMDILRGAEGDAIWVRDTDPDGLAAVERAVVDSAEEVVLAARRGDAAGGLRAAVERKVLSATRQGRLGLQDWGDRIEAAVCQRLPDLARHQRWYVGRPIIVTANDALNGVANGDVGLVVQVDGVSTVAMARGNDVRQVAPSRLDQVETWWAMTIHKSQGSEFGHVVVSLPPASSPILTRELLYTAVTRARDHVTLVGSEAALRVAIARPVSRASGLRDRLWRDPASG